MKKTYLILMMPIVLILCSTPPKKVEKTVVGMFTPYNFFPETLNGKVKEIKESNYWAMENDGSVVAGDRITQKDRDSLLNWTNDFRIEFDLSGLAANVSFLDENDEVIGTWKIMNENEIMKSAKWIVKDTIRRILTNIVAEDGSSNFEIKDAKADTLLSKVKRSFKENMKYDNIQLFNFKGESTTKFDYNYDENGNLVEYTFSRKDTIRGGMKFSYNENGFTESQEVYNLINDTTSTYSYKYEYDENGNWTKYVAYKDGEPEVVGKREYIYY